MTLWNKYDIKDMPNPRKEILTWNGFHHTVVLIDREDWEQGFCDWIKKWAYITDLYATADRAELLQKAVEWLVGGDTGISSKTMCAALFGATPKDSDMPHDADDFGRCLRFIRFMPDGTKDIVFEKLSDKPEWVEIGNRWDELVELYDQENWRGIYDILSAIRKEYRQPRPNEIFIGL